MNAKISAGKDLYYTKDHEWIDFQGTVAYAGICSFKLLGFKEIHQIFFTGYPGLKKHGEVIATIRYKDYQVTAHMPVEGKLVEINEALLSGNRNILLQYPENNGWIAKIIPQKPFERRGLLISRQYQMIGKYKYAK